MADESPMKPPAQKCSPADLERALHGPLEKHPVLKAYLHEFYEDLKGVAISLRGKSDKP
jgi:hypothetical protein